MHTIKILGLGPGGLDQMPVGIYEEILSTTVLYVRTADHPAINELRERGKEIISFDSIYEKNEEEFEKVYPEIVEKLKSLSEHSEVVYAVPGHPMMAEKTVQLLLESDCSVDILGGKSFLDDLFQSVRVDPVEGFQLIDAFDLHHDRVNSDQHVVIMQVFNPLMASEVKLTLMEVYPADHRICVIDAAGSSGEQKKWMPLYELDRFEGVYNLRSVYIPPLALEEQTRSFSTLQSAIDQITADTGDVWINQQTHQSLLPFLKEETQELIEAFEKEDSENIIEELGDVLLQVLYHTNLAEKSGEFSFEDVLEEINLKLKRRHPHVFGEVSAHTIEEVQQLWESIKEEEKRGKDI